MISLKYKSRSLSLCKRYFSLDGRQRLSNKFIPVTKDKNAHLSSHTMLLKAGFVRQSGAGIYSLLPLGLRVIEKIERIIDEEMQSIGSEKLSLPMLLNPDGWKKTGRWDGAKGEFFRFKDRKESDLLLAPTHEEEITQLVGKELRTAKQLPIRLYQIGRKYRDELRPRAGLLRGREFIMKDLYSFDATQTDAYKTYDEVAEAYHRIFTRIGVPFVVAEADSGNIGGSKSHEYHLISKVGEDTLLTCSSCGYTANEELAVGTMNQEPSNQKMLARFSGVNATEDGSVQGIAAVYTPEGRSPNLLKVQKTLSDYLKKHQQLSDKATVDLHVVPSDQKIEEPRHIFIDDACTDISADKSSITHKRDHFRLAKAGDLCGSCKSREFDSVKAIECGHTFYLGTKYSKVLDCGYREGNQKADKIPVEMGCYGIGISRLLAAVAEARYDSNGITWPQSLAPYSVCIVPTDDRKKQFQDLAEVVYDALQKNGYNGEVVIDDRRSGFGAKMKDAELVGYPYTVVIGSKAFEEGGIVEVHGRSHGRTSEKKLIPLELLLNDNKSIDF